MNNIYKYLLLSITLFYASDLLATHNRAGEITIVQIGDLTLRATITTYTKTSSVPADRDSLQICWGDGSCQWVLRDNGNGEGEPLGNDIKYNTYTAEHTYPGRATYTISMQDPNRNAGILNVNAPNSDVVPFYIETVFTFLNTQFQGYNNSPLLLQPPIDVGYVGQPFIHNPNAFDQEGDSLAYELIVPSMDVGMPVVNYQFPDAISPGANNTISLNSLTGDFLWDAPQQAGEYNIAILIKEYRQGQLISTIVRDMQILILEGDNQPPVIETIDEICVIAGDTVAFDVIATDPDLPEQLVRLSALGGPFQLQPNPATFTVASGFQPQPLIGQFFWIPPCEVISDQYYSVVFKAQDDFNTGEDTLGLSTLKTVRIKVVGPPPQDVQIEASSEQVSLTWEAPYACEFTENDYFQGFSIWKRPSSNQFEIDTCTPGLEGKGYTRIALDVNDLVNNRYQYIDTDVESGRSYCYRILGEFAQTSAGSNPFNRVQSLTSEEVCIQLRRDLPLITNVSVETTATSSGQMYIAWTKPLAEDLDTLFNAPPYTFELLRAEGFAQGGFLPVPGATFTSNSFFELVDTTFIDNNLNTQNTPYTYKINFYVNGDTEPLGETSTASSIFLSVASTDEENILSWEEFVPWDNESYTIYRRNNATGIFDSIGVSINQSYNDIGLENGVEYCYYVRSEGTYGIEGIIDPILNLSQEACGVPLDSIPPCAPSLMVENDCEVADPSTPAESFQNRLTWTNPNNSCADDVQNYNIYYASTPNDNFSIIETTTTAEDTSLIHQPSFVSIAGCYAVTALDSLGNESIFSDTVCVDNCPIYELPNVFTPNEDGSNDLFVPFPYRFVSSIDIKIYNRWGGLVFETNDPNISWDGTDLQGEALEEAVYYYVCRVTFDTINGPLELPELLEGYIHLIRG